MGNSKTKYLSGVTFNFRRAITWCSKRNLSFLGFPTETHELNPFGNPNDFAQNGSNAGMATTQFTGDYDAGYQQGGGNFPQR